MARITVEDCLEKLDNQYDLVLLAKERTVQLNSGSPMLVEEDNGLHYNLRSPRTAVQLLYGRELKRDELLKVSQTALEDIMNEELSKKTKATLRKKAEDRGLTAGSVEAEYKKGLAAWASSGSRKGMTQHQWAMARVNSAQPSKSWAVVKKSKAKKKK